MVVIFIAETILFTQLHLIASYMYLSIPESNVQLLGSESSLVIELFFVMILDEISFYSYGYFMSY